MFKKTIKWLDNFWYHNKWQTLLIAFFVVFAIVAASQMALKKEGDVFLLYGGPGQFTPNETLEIQSAFQSLMSGDYNGDGEKYVQFISILLMTQEQIEAAYKNAASQGEVLINSGTIIQNRSQFATQIFAGEAVICLLDPNWYTDIYKSDGFIQLSHVLGYTPENAIDEYSIYLRDIQAAQYFTVLKLFPGDTILCVRRMSSTTAFKSLEKETARYENQLQMFRDIMSFTLNGTD